MITAATIPDNHDNRTGRHAHHAASLPQYFRNIPPLDIGVQGFRGMTLPGTSSREQLLPVLGVEVVDITMQEAIDRLLDILHKPERTAHAVYFVNAHTLNLACDDEEYRELLGRGSYVFGDGTGVRWAARLLHGVRLKDNVNGTDLTPRLFAQGLGQGLRYFLLGNHPGRIERAAAYTQAHFPGWTLAGYHHGYLQDPSINEEAIWQIRAAEPHLLLVGMGNPLQEIWINRHLHALGVPLCMGTGGLFDYWSGDLERAPALVRRLGYEWLHIMFRQPAKLRRYMIGNPLFLARVAQQRRHRSH
jgi:N-acetylglucosaminyldiphosphoundecaprenol N-acetyl-beta-D-mannosaminyltransferase